jgi:hypothetical protein
MKMINVHRIQPGIASSEKYNIKKEETNKFLKVKI